MAAHAVFDFPVIYSHMVNTCYRNTHCLGGYSAISLACQFQTRKIVHGFRKMFLLIIPIVYLTIIANCECFKNNSVSVSVALQINCMHAKRIRYPYRRRQSTFTLCFIRHIYHMLCYFSLLYTWLIILILLSRDISESPGPSDTESSDSDISKDSLNLSIFENIFSVVHYNIQSLANKVDQLQVELSHFDVIALSETWLNPSISDDDIMFQNFQKPFRKDRIHNNYGGFIIYVKENIACKRRQDLENNQIESIWVELRL